MTKIDKSKIKNKSYVSYLNPQNRNFKPILLRDVMNSKSSFIKRHSCNAYDLKEISKWYAIDCHLYNSVWDNDFNRWKKGDHWILNTMVFDIDLDPNSDNLKNLNEKEIIEKLDLSIKKLESILGKPKYLIRNKTSYTQKQIDNFFTKIDEKTNEKIVKLPKKYGCQVIYELNESVTSEMFGVRDVYNYVRLVLTDIINADKQFNGYMHKNYYNKELFNVIENKDDSKIDIFKIAKLFNYRNSKAPENILNNTDAILEEIKSLKPYEKLGDKEKLNKYLMYYTSKLENYYSSLNRWNNSFIDNGNYNGGGNLSNSMYNKTKIDVSNVKTSGRNNTLFNFFKSNNLETLKSFYNDLEGLKTLIENLNLFSNCIEKSMLSDYEIISTLESTINYKEQNGDIANTIDSFELLLQSDKNIDIRVFKVDQSSYDYMFFGKNKCDLYKSSNVILNSNNLKIKRYWMNKHPLKITLYKNDSFSKFLSNVFIHFSSEKILSNISNLFSQNMIDFYKEIYKNYIGNKNFNFNDLSLYNLYCYVKEAIFLTHFKYYNAIKESRNKDKKGSCLKYEISIKNKKQDNFNIIRRNQNDRKKIFNKYCFDYNGPTIGFYKYFMLIKKEKLLKPDGNPYPISFYQRKFNIRTSIASYYVRLIKNFITFLNSNIISKENTKMIDIKQIFNCKINPSEIKNNIINNFIIYKDSYNNNKIHTYYNYFNIYGGIIFNNNIYYILIKNLNIIKTKIINNITDELICFKYIIIYIFYCYYNLFIIKERYSFIKKFLFIGENDMKYLLFDTETTGLNPKKSFILSIGAIMYDSKTNNISEFYKVLNWKQIMSNFYIPEDTIKIHGLTQDILDKEGEHPLKVMSDFITWIDDFVHSEDLNSNLDAIVAFNIPFDLNMMISNLKYLNEIYCPNFEHDFKFESNSKNLLYLLTRKYHEDIGSHPLIIDSLLIDRIFHFEVDGEKVSHNLQAVGERYNIPEDPNAHNAIADTRRTLKVFKIQLEELKEKNIDINQDFETRLIKSFNRVQEYRGWNKKADAVDYLAENMCSVGI